jgi:hypothetical protein
MDAAGTEPDADAEAVALACRAMDAAGVAPDASAEAVRAVALVLRWGAERCTCGIPKGCHTEPLWVGVHERDDANGAGTALGRGERRR